MKLSFFTAILLIFISLSIVNTVNGMDLPMLNVSISNARWNPLQEKIQIEFYLPEGYPGVAHCIFENEKHDFIFSVTETAAEGKNTLSWDGLNDKGERCPKGSYSVNLYFSKMKKITDLKPVASTEYWNWTYDTPDQGGNWLAFDPVYNILWACDPEKREIVRFNSEGMVERKWQRSIDGIISFKNVVSLSTTASGHLLVADDEEYLIREFMPSGGEIRLKASPSYKAGLNHVDTICSDIYNNIYIGDSRCYKIRKIDSSGNHIITWGSYGSGQGQFAEIDSLYSSGEYIFTVDSKNHRVQIFSLAGEFIRSIGSYGSGSDQFYKPANVVTDHNRVLYIADSGNFRIQVYSFSGKIMQSYRVREESGRQLKPSCIAFDPKGYLWIGDYVQGLLVKVPLPLENRILQERDTVLVEY